MFLKNDDVLGLLSSWESPKKTLVWFCFIQAFCGPAFQLLSQDKGMIEHPDTIDDLFRLCGR